MDGVEVKPLRLRLGHKGKEASEYYRFWVATALVLCRPPLPPPPRRHKTNVFLKIQT